MSKQVEFYYDYGSPTTYLAWTQLPAICERYGAELIYRPMLLGGVFKATGNTTPVRMPRPRSIGSSTNNRARPGHSKPTCAPMSSPGKLGDGTFMEGGLV